METRGLYPCLASSSSPISDSCGRYGCPLIRQRNTTAGRRRRRSSARWMPRACIVISLFAAATLFFAVFGHEDGANNHEHTDFRSNIGISSTGRRLLSTTSANSTPVSGGGGHGTASCDYEKEHVPALFVVVYALIVLVFFISLALICDDFFVPSLEAISERLDLSEDVAGATFMAAGSSAPELFTSVAGATTKSDVGVGTIVGSAVFNILIIIALTCALAGQVLELDYRPLLRDSSFYGLSIACFIAFSWDGYFELWEAIMLLVLYGLYITLMKFNSRIMDLRCPCRKSRVEPLEVEASQTDVTEGGKVNGSEECPPLPQKECPHIGERKHSTVSTTHSASGLHASNSTKHIFHHVKHGELASSFTSSQMEMKRPGESDSRVGSRCGGQMGSRVLGSLAGGVIMETAEEEYSSAADHWPKMSNRAAKRSNPHQAIIECETVSGRVAVLDSNNNDDRDDDGDEGETFAPLAEGDDSLSGRSGDLGSRSHLIVPFACMTDADSGIHSAHNMTPVHLDLSYPPPDAPPSPDPSDLKASKRHSITVVHHDHHEALTAVNELHQAVPEDIEEQSEDELIDEELTLRPIPCLPAISMYYPDREAVHSRCGAVLYALKWVMFFVSFPFMCAFTWTIPNCSNPKYKKFYMVSFLMSIAWIAVLSFGMVSVVAQAGCILQIDAYTMGLVIVAIGTSVPDALSSVLVARDGFGDMAVSNAIGSNVFDINLGLGLPFLIRIIADGNVPLLLLSPEDHVLFMDGTMPITPHAKFGFILMGILLVTLTVFALVRFRLNKVVGISFVLLYVAFLIYAFVQELVCTNGSC